MKQIKGKNVISPDSGYLIAENKLQTRKNGINMKKFWCNLYHRKIRRLFRIKGNKYSAED